MVTVITCLAERSESEVRRGLAVAWPDLSIESLELAPYHRQTNPRWSSSSAVVNGALVAKFAWSEVRAARLYREGVILQRLTLAAPSLPLPTVLALSPDPVIVATRRVHGEPLPWHSDDVPAERLAPVAAVLGEFLATLHQVDADGVLRDSAAPPIGTVGHRHPARSVRRSGRPRSQTPSARVV